MAEVPYVIGDPYIDADFAALSAVTPNIGASVSTTNATPTTIATVVLPTGVAALIDVMVAARRTGGSAGSAGDAGGYVAFAVVKNIAGTASVVNQIASFGGGDQNAWTVTFVASGADILIKVKGAVNNNIDWTLVGSTMVVS